MIEYLRGPLVSVEEGAAILEIGEWVYAFLSPTPFPFSRRRRAGRLLFIPAW